ncbi:MFS transporter [Enterococcus faecalis]
MFSKEKDKNIILYYIYYFLLNVRFSRGVLLLYCLSLEISLLEFGTIQSFYFFSKVLLEIPSGILADRYRKKNMLTFGTAICSLTYLSFFLVPFTNIAVFPTLIFLFSLDAIGSAFISGTDQSVLYEYLQSNQRQDEFIRVFGNAQITGLFILSIATALGGEIYSWGFSIVFLIQSIFYFMAIFAVFFMKEYEIVRETNKITHQSLLEQLKKIWVCLNLNKNISCLILFMTLLEVYANFLMSFIQGAFSDVGVTNSVVSLIIGGATFIGILGTYSSRFFENLNLSYFILIFSVFFVTGCVLLSLNQVILLLVGFFLINILVDAAYPYVSNGLNNNLENSMRSSILSIFSTIISLISLLMYPILGWLVDNLDYSFTFISVGAMFFLGMFFLCIYSYRR